MQGDVTCVVYRVNRKTRTICSKLPNQERHITHSGSLPVKQVASPPAFILFDRPLFSSNDLQPFFKKRLLMVLFFLLLNSSGINMVQQFYLVGNIFFFILFEKRIEQLVELIKTAVIKNVFTGAFYFARFTENLCIAIIQSEVSIRAGCFLHQFFNEFFLLTVNTYNGSMPAGDRRGRWCSGYCSRVIAHAGEPAKGFGQFGFTLTMQTMQI